MRTLYDFFHRSVRCDRHLLTVIYPSTLLFILSSCTKVCQYIMIFIWPFLPLFRPLKRHNGQVFLGLPDLTIVQNPHAHSVNHMPNVQIMKTIMLWNVLGTTGHCSSVRCLWGIWVSLNFQQAVKQAQWPVHGRLYCIMVFMDLHNQSCGFAEWLCGFT